MTNAPIANLEALVVEVRRGFRPKYLFFWGHHAASASSVGKECLSQWWPASFTIDGERYATAEHFMMAEKARLFGDEDARRRILAAPSPELAKKLGRAVKNFDEHAWAEARFELVVKGNIGKFQQNPELAEFLSGTRERVLVEASPVDRVWGIGLAADDAAAPNPELWRGLNLLGFALMQTRSQLTVGD